MTATTTKALGTYLNDHLGGAMIGSELAGQIRDRAVGTPLGDLVDRLASEIHQDRQSLVDLMEQLGVDRNHVKEATAWVAERVSRIKFSGRLAGSDELGLFGALETLSLGVEGKLALWVALSTVADDHPAIASAGIDTLIERARSQHEALERERVAMAARLFAAH